jgi:hypothetical protein
MGGLSRHLAPSTEPRRHLLDEMGGSRNFDLLAFGNIEPGAGERRLDFCSVHHAFSLSGIGRDRYGKPTA